MKTGAEQPVAARLSLSPGGLLAPGERVAFTATRGGLLVVRRFAAGPVNELARAELAPAQPWRWEPPGCGQFLAEFTGAGETIRRPFAVADRDWAVCQITVGAFTSEDFAGIIHPAGVAADYYVMLEGAPGGESFSAGDPRWRDYERLHGDAIHPHVMARDIGCLDPAMAHHDANWDTLSLPEIIRRLAALQTWWRQQGYEPLDRLATYTPSNLFARACRETGIRVMHSLVPEQNWSDGEWAINHWGMPTCPFWIAADDFRKAGARDERGVLGMTMNHFHVLAPHLTHWGDFVLSPSHFTRWLRAADVGDESTRFRSFLADTVRGGTALGATPFFFVAGFEFGRTFGTADMTEWNRAGLRRLLDLAKSAQLVFSTSTDVRAYHDRHVPVLASRAFRQRDNWVGVTVNGKPGQAGDTVVFECAAYKALAREGESLPWMYYDYRVAWNFGTRDAHAPADFAKAGAAELRIEHRGPLGATLVAPEPLSRAIPVVFWDADVMFAPFPRLSLKPLEDGRAVCALEIPAGWQGCVEIPLAPAATGIPARRRSGHWELQTFGSGTEQHTYLHLDAPLVADVTVNVQLRRAARVDGTGCLLGEKAAGAVALVFGPMRTWYRFWGCVPADLGLPAVDREVLAQSGALLAADWPDTVRAHAASLGAVARAHPAFHGGELVCEMFCGANLPLGTRSRAEAHDLYGQRAAGVSAHEHSDGVIAFGPARAFWYHPRALGLRIDGLNTATGGKAARWTVLLNSFDPLGLDASYLITVGEACREVGAWALPSQAEDKKAFFSFDVTPVDFDRDGRLTVTIKTNQQQILRWWDERGFIAALHALWVTRRD